MATDTVLAVLDAFPETVHTLARRHGAATQLAAVAAFTAELFDCEVRVAVKCDPEGELAPHFSVCVTGRGSVDEIARTNDSWHRRLLATAGEAAPLFCLSIEFA